MDTDYKKQDSPATAAADIVIQAAEAAKDVARSSDQHVTDILSGALRDVFGEHEASGRFIDASRIPLICQNIHYIFGSLKKIEDSVDARNNDHEIRLRWIEKSIWKWIGILFIVPPMVTIGIAWILSIIIKK